MSIYFDPQVLFIVVTQKTYRKWCQENNFQSMLPDDAKARRTEQLETTTTQTAVNDHFSTQKPEDKPKSYSDVLFEEAAIQWLIETDQVRISVDSELSY
jgi:hypothetical protein